MAYSTIISTADLHDKLENGGVKVFDCRFALHNADKGRLDYQENHIPGAIYAHLDRDLSSPKTSTSGRHPLPDPSKLSKQLGAWGVSNSTQVVVYDDVSGAFAGRMWWLLRWLGHPKVAVLDGGYRKWLREKRPVTNHISTYKQQQFVSKKDDSLWVDTAAVLSMSKSKQGKLLDARTIERFTGEKEPIDSIAGHIPGAICKPLSDNLDESGCFQNPAVLKRKFKNVIGNVKPKNVIHSCGSGVSACHNLLAMEHAGLQGSKLYVGSWSEWITDSSRPIASGP